MTVNELIAELDGVDGDLPIAMPDYLEILAIDVRDDAVVLTDEILGGDGYDDDEPVRRNLAVG